MTNTLTHADTAVLSTRYQGRRVCLRSLPALLPFRLCSCWLLPGTPAESSDGSSSDSHHSSSCAGRCQPASILPGLALQRQQQPVATRGVLVSPTKADSSCGPAPVCAVLTCPLSTKDKLEAQQAAGCWGVHCCVAVNSCLELDCAAGCGRWGCRTTG